MNKSVTSREQLLAAAGELARTEGLSQVSIRAVAARCGVAVGSIYNYFPTKADLIAAVIEDFWRSAIHMESCAPETGEPFPAYVGRLYGSLARELSAFQSGWLSQIAALGSEERQKGRVLEAKCFDHMKGGLRAALEQCGADGPLLQSPSDRDAFVDFVFRNLMACLRMGDADFGYFRRILEALLLP